MTIPLGPPPFTGMLGTVMSLKSRVILAYHQNVVPPTPPTPPPAPIVPTSGGGGGGGSIVRPPYFEHDLWKWRCREQKLKQKQEALKDRERERKAREKQQAIELRDKLRQELREEILAEIAEKGAPAQVEYAILPVGRVRALVGGVVRYVADSKSGPGAIVHGDDGVRYFYGGVMRAPEAPAEGTHVDAGQVIGHLSAKPVQVRTERDASVKTADARSALAGHKPLPALPAGPMATAKSDEDDVDYAIVPFGQAPPDPLEPIAPTPPPAAEVLDKPAKSPLIALALLSATVGIVWWLSTRRSAPPRKRLPAKKKAKKRKHRR